MTAGTFPTIEAEQAVLGALLTNNDGLAHVSGFLRSEHFYDPMHGQVFESISRRIEKGESATPITLKAEYENHDGMKTVGGAVYLFNLIDAAIVVFDLGSHAQEIVDGHARRTMHADALDAIEELSKGLSPDDVAARMADKWSSVTTRQENRMAHVSEALADALAAMEEAELRKGAPAGVTSGLRDLDDTINGFEKEAYYILAGRPSMGKTAKAVSIAASAARAGEGVFFASLEMPSKRLGLRLASNHAETRGVIAPYFEAERGRLMPEQRDGLIAAARDFRSAPIIIDDTPLMSLAQIRASALRARTKMRKWGGDLDLLIVDYLQLIKPPQDRRGNKVAEITDISSGLMGMAKELRVPVLALSQLSRSVEQRENKRPVMSDLRESGAIEQDADTIMFVYREEYYAEREAPAPNAAPEDHADHQQRMSQCRNALETIVAKNRHGPIKTVHSFCDVKTNTVRDIARHHYQEAAE